MSDLLFEQLLDALQDLVDVRHTEAQLARYLLNRTLLDVVEPERLPVELWHPGLDCGEDLGGPGRRLVGDHLTQLLSRLGAYQFRQLARMVGAADSIAVKPSLLAPPVI